MLRENSKLKEEIIIDRIETQNKDLKQKEEFDDIVKKLQNENDKFQKVKKLLIFIIFFADYNIKI